MYIEREVVNVSVIRGSNWLKCIKCQQGVHYSKKNDTNWTIFSLGHNTISPHNTTYYTSIKAKNQLLKGFDRRKPITSFRGHFFNDAKFWWKVLIFKWTICLIVIHEFFIKLAKWSLVLALKIFKDGSSLKTCKTTRDPCISLLTTLRYNGGTDVLWYMWYSEDIHDDMRNTFKKYIIS